VRQPSLTYFLQTGGLKVAGVLIESAPPYVLIGIGVNIRQAPTVDTTGAERGKCVTVACDYIS
jgi:biotin-(acetyl-CoA carboxylase) ligase